MNLFRDHERFKNISAGFQSIAIGVAVLVGGIWAAYVFRAELRLEHARLTAESMELKNREDTRKAEVVRFDTEPQIEQVASDMGSMRYLSVLVTISNPCSKEIWLNLEGEPVTATKVTLAKSGEKLYGPTFAASAERIGPDGHRVKLSTLYVNPGDKESLPFLLVVDQPGLYLIGYSSHSGIGKVSDLVGGATKSWGAAKYVQVR